MAFIEVYYHIPRLLLTTLIQCPLKKTMQGGWTPVQYGRYDLKTMGANEIAIQSEAALEITN
jgi:hypothetical protein